MDRGSVFRRLWTLSLIVLSLVAIGSLPGCVGEQIQVVVHYPSSQNVQQLQFRLVENREDCGWRENETVFQVPEDRTISTSSFNCPADFVSSPKVWVCVVGRDDLGLTMSRLVPLTKQSCEVKQVDIFLYPHGKFSSMRVSEPSKTQPTPQVLTSSIPLLGMRATVLENGEVVLTGGVEQSGLLPGVRKEKLADAIQHLNPATGRVRSALSLKNPRAFHLQYMDGRKLVLCGGLREKKEPRTEVLELGPIGKWLNVQITGPPKTASDDWVLIGAAVTPYGTGDQRRLLIAGGVLVRVTNGYDADKWVPNASIWRVSTQDFTPCAPFGTDSKGLPTPPPSWQTIGAMETPRLGHSVTVFGANQFLFLGGLEVGVSSPTSAKSLRGWLAKARTELASPFLLKASESGVSFVKIRLDNTLQQTFSRVFHSTTRIAEDSFLVVGGLNNKLLVGTSAPGPLKFRLNKSGEVTAPVEFTSSALRGVHFHTTVSLPFDAVYILGGNRIQGSSSHDWLFLPEVQGWSREWKNDGIAPEFGPIRREGNNSDAGVPEEPGTKPDNSEPGDVSEPVQDQPDGGTTPDTSQPQTLKSRGFLVGTNNVTAVRVATGTNNARLFSALFKPSNERDTEIGWFRGTQSVGSSTTYAYKNDPKAAVSLLVKTNEKGDRQWMVHLEPERFANPQDESPFVFAVDKDNDRVILAGRFFSMRGNDGKPTNAVLKSTPMDRRLRATNVTLQAKGEGWNLFVVVLDLSSGHKKQMSNNPAVYSINNVSGCTRKSDCTGVIELVSLHLTPSRAGCGAGFFLSYKFRGRIGFTFRGSTPTSHNYLGERTLPGVAYFDYSTNVFSFRTSWSLESSDKGSSFFSTLFSTTLTPTGELTLAADFEGTMKLASSVLGNLPLGKSISPLLLSLQCEKTNPNASPKMKLTHVTVLGQTPFGKAIEGLKASARKIAYVPGTSPPQFGLVVQMDSNSAELKGPSGAVNKIGKKNSQLILARINQSSGPAGSLGSFGLDSFRNIYINKTDTLPCKGGFDKIVQECLSVLDLVATNQHFYLVGATTLGKDQLKLLTFDDAPIQLPAGETPPLMGFVVRTKTNLKDSTWSRGVYTGDRFANTADKSLFLKDTSRWIVHSLAVTKDNGSGRETVSLLGNFQQLSWSIEEVSIANLRLGPQAAPGAKDAKSILGKQQLFLWTTGPAFPK